MTEDNGQKIRAGDHVFHKPSGETWTVADVNYESRRLAWCGWPPGQALLDDCELVYQATDREHEWVLRDVQEAGRRAV